MKKKFDITGMTCSACSAHVENAVRKTDGVKDVSVNLLTESMTVEFDENAVGTDKIVSSVEKAGYGAAPSDKAEQLSSPRQKQQGDGVAVRLIISVIFSVLVMYVSMGPMIGIPLPPFLSGEKNAVSAALAQFLLCLPVIYLNRSYFINGTKRLFSGAPNMDTLISVGASASLLYGIYAMFRMSFALGAGEENLIGEYYRSLSFESAAMILALVTLGKYFEGRSKKRTGDAVSKLKNLVPPRATVRRDGKEITIDSFEIRTGDVLLLKTGMSVPADGRIIKGNCFADESAVSGESVPVEKSVSDNVIGGTVIKGGYAEAEVTAVGEESLLSGIIRLVEEAGATKAPIARLADKISAVFVPVVMGIALVTFIVWTAVGQSFDFSLMRAVSVLVISCPCALGLATPVAIMVSVGKGAENGILIKNGDAMQTLASAKYIVLDKTGTVTEGRPAVTDVFAVKDEDQFISLVAGIEKLSEHPLGEAVVRYASEKELAFYEAAAFKTLSGKGIEAETDDGIVYVGNAALMSIAGVDGEIYSAKADKFAAEGKTPIMAAKRGGEFLGIIAVADEIKSESKRAVSELEKLGLEVIMLTGDNERTARAVANRAGIKEVYAGVLPDEKQFKIEELKKQGKTVMVGDGINDAPALTAADVGIAVGRGSDIAIDSADIVLVKDSLLDVADACRLSRATLRNIKQNLFWAFFYNTLGIPLAAGVLYATPLALTLNSTIAAAAMSVSSLFVVGNALRLRLFKSVRAKNNKRRENSNLVPSADETSEPKKENEMEKFTLKVEGMTCAHCVAHVKEALEKADGVDCAKVYLDEGKAEVFCRDGVSEKTLINAVESAGYTASEMSED